MDSAPGSNPNLAYAQSTMTSSVGFILRGSSRRSASNFSETKGNTLAAPGSAKAAYAHAMFARFWVSHVSILPIALSSNDA